LTPRGSTGSPAAFRRSRAAATRREAFPRPGRRRDHVAAGEHGRNALRQCTEAGIDPIERRAADVPRIGVGAAAAGPRWIDIVDEDDGRPGTVQRVRGRRAELVAPDHDDGRPLPFDIACAHASLPLHVRSAIIAKLRYSLMTAAPPGNRIRARRA
jgi:hypothetical protein